MTADNGSTETISKIEVVDKIAFQTDILVLHAALAAAGDGDEGRGVASAANELRKLARLAAQTAATDADLAATKASSSARARRSAAVSHSGPTLGDVQGVVEALGKTAAADDRNRDESVSANSADLAMLGNALQKRGPSSARLDRSPVQKRRSFPHDEWERAF